MCMSPLPIWPVATPVVTARPCGAAPERQFVGSPGVKMSTGQRVSELSADTLGPTVPRMLVGIQLHRLREAAGVTPERAGHAIRASRSKISRMENGRVSYKE